LCRIRAGATSGYFLQPTALSANPLFSGRRKPQSGGAAGGPKHNAKVFGDIA
jgi:hypothetical protein